MTQDLGQAIREIWDGQWSERRLARLATALAEDYVRHSSRGTQGKAEFLKSVHVVRNAFPDVATSVEDTVAAGDKVASRWTAVGTHLGVYLGAPPTHDRLVVRGITITRWQDEMIVEDWVTWDPGDLLISLGVIPLDII